MKVIVISMVKDEQDVIESFVRHCFTFCDEMIICDHMSSDRTPEILRLLQAEGLAITIERETRAERVQAEVTTRLMHEAGRRDADWVLPLDADEFVLAHDGMNVREILPGSDQAVYLMSWRNSAPINPYEDEDRFLLLRPAVWDANESLAGQIFMRGSVARQQTVRIVQGNHYLERLHDGEWRNVSMSRQPQLYFAHYNHRSPEQFASKIGLLRMNAAAKYTRYTIYSHYGDYDNLAAHGLPTWESLLPPEREPVPQSELGDASRFPALRYSGNVRPNFLGNIMSSAMMLADRVAVLKALSQGTAVTIVVPYLGDGGSFAAALRMAMAQDYPYKRVLALAVSSLPEALHCDSVSVVSQTELPTAAQSRYVQWVLPGESVSADQLSVMANCLECHRLSNAHLPVGLLIGAQLTVPPFIVGDMPKAGLFTESRNNGWLALLDGGAFPVCDLANVLIRRELMDAAHWFDGCFLNRRRPLYLAMWRLLLCAGADNAALTHFAFTQNGYLPESNVALDGDRELYQMQLEMYRRREQQLEHNG